VRILIRPRLPVLALLLLAPSIPELLTGSTPVSNLIYNPAGFAVSYGFDIALYGTGALLIREASVILAKGWASALLWGAAYGIAEEGFAVHTFFERSGPPVGALTVYGSAYGVNWLWALGLTVFHATYSIALPILLTYLWFPGSRGVRWLDRGSVVLVAVVYVAVVAIFARLVGHGPSPEAFALFALIEAILLVAGARVPSGLLRVGPGPRRIGRGTIGVAGSLEWIAWLAVLLASGGPRLLAWGSAVGLAVLDALALGLVVRYVGREDLERSEFAFATGMMVPLFFWDLLFTFSIPGILAVSGLFAYLLYRFGAAIDLRASARGSPATPTSLG